MKFLSSVIIGTAGHIDHGKTALIRALNGFEGDRTEAEKSRGITIDLSFSNLAKEEKNIAFIDVPGHENLVKTMISGAFAFDASLVVIACDDGIMPQSKEHIEILSILGVKNLILVFTKCDLVGISRQNEVENEARKFCENFKNLSILKSFFVSSKTGENIENLREFLFEIKPIKRENSGVFHYYIDRVFSLKGHGTIVTGSLIDGEISQNEKIYNCDLDRVFAVKSLQIHDKSAVLATAPNRVALNLDAKVTELKKGQILTKKGFFRGFKSVDCNFFGKISHGENVTFCVGTRQISGVAQILSENFVTFKFEKEIFVKFGEKFVILRNSRLCGGGEILNAISEPLKKNLKISLLKTLQNRDFKASFEILTKNHKHGFGLISSYQRFNLNHENALKIAKTLNGVILDETALCIYDFSAVLDIKNFVRFIISKNQNALLSAQSVSLKLPWASLKICELALNELKNEKILDQNGNLFMKFGQNLENLQQNLESQIFEILQNAKFSPDAPYNIYDDLEIDRNSGDNALKKLTKSKKVVRLAHNLFVTTQNLNEVMKILREIIKNSEFIDISKAKEALKISRKFLICYLEFLDNFDDIVKIDQKRYFKK